ncbi:Cupin domain protein [Caballeronia telluris]|uniref:Cupin domain protein n=2 Tax=Caballeronia telluris TaxID=326475 RepID=A0A158KEQ0_9BURK|nr:Cupin domain protein [Caballeronia telluris]
MRVTARRRQLATLTAFMLTFGLCGQGLAQCRPVGERTQDIGCWIIERQPLGQLQTASLFWYLGRYRSREEAQAARGPKGIVIEAYGSSWLSTIEQAGWRQPEAERVIVIGPLQITKPGVEYTAQYMEGTFTPGMSTDAHYHPGPEAIYTLTGEVCFEMPHGNIVGRAGEGIVMESGHLHTLTATGIEQRRSLALVVYESAQPWRFPSAGWEPQGLCK